MASVAQHYKLPDDEARRIFDEQIAPREFGHLDHLPPPPAGRRPVAAFLVGQTGAGKTRIAPGLAAALTALGRPHAHFIADTYKTYHPQYPDICRVRPDLASPAAGPDARRWLEMACRRCAAAGRDALVESACRHPGDLAGLAAPFRDAGYRVCVAVLAVPEPLSLLGILVRYHRRLPEAMSGGLPLRLTPLRVHDDSYAGLLAAAEFVDRSDAADHVVVVRRGGLVAYANSRAEAPPGEPAPAPAPEPAAEGGAGEGREGTAAAPARPWLQPAQARSALDLERVRPLLDGELATALADLAEVEQLPGAQEQRETAARLAEVERLLSAVQVHGPKMGPFPALRPLDPAAFLEGRYSVTGVADEGDGALPGRHGGAEEGREGGEPEGGRQQLSAEEKLAHDDP